MKDLKFRVHNEEHSKAIQKRLFELGCVWGSGGKSIQFQAKPFLYLEENKIKFWIGVDYFNDHEAAEATLDDLYNDDFLKAEEPNYLGAWFVDVIVQLDEIVKEGKKLIEKHKNQ